MEPRSCQQPAASSQSTLAAGSRLLGATLVSVYASDSDRSPAPRRGGGRSCTCRKSVSPMLELSYVIPITINAERAEKHDSLRTQRPLRLPLLTQLLYNPPAPDVAR